MQFLVTPPPPESVTDWLMEEVSAIPRPPFFGALAACSLCIRAKHSGQLMLILSLKKVIRPPHSSNARRRRWEAERGGEWEIEVMAEWERPSKGCRRKKAARDAFRPLHFPRTIHFSSNYES